MATSADKPVHQPSEKHTLDEVLKSLQDLVRNDFDRPVPPAPAPSKRPSAHRAKDDHFSTTDAIGELMASLASLTGQEASPAATEVSDESSDALPLIDVDELQAASDQLRVDTAAVARDRTPAPAVTAVAKPSSDRPAATNPSFEPEPADTAEPEVDELSFDPDDAIGTDEPVAPPARSPLREPETDVEADDLGIDASAFELDGSEADTEANADADADIDLDLYADADAAFETDAEIDGAPAPTPDDNLPITPVADFEAPSMELDALSSDTGKPTKPDDRLLAVSDFEAPSLELESLPPLDLATDTDTEADKSQSRLVPATDFEMPTPDIESLSLDPEATSTAGRETRAPHAAATGNTRPAANSRPDRPNRKSLPAAGKPRASDRPVGRHRDSTSTNEPPAPAASAKKSGARPSAPDLPLAGVRPAAALNTGKPLELAPPAGSAAATPMTTPDRAVNPPAPPPRKDDAPQAPAAGGVDFKPSAPNRVSLPPSAVIKTESPIKSGSAPPELNAKPATSAKSEAKAATPATPFRPDNTGVRSGAIPRPTGIPKAIAKVRDSAVANDTKTGRRATPKPDAQPVAASPASTTMHKTTAPAAVTPGEVPPGGLQQELPLLAQEPPRDFAATVPIPPYFVERAESASPVSTRPPSSEPKTPAAADGGTESANTRAATARPDTPKSVAAKPGEAKAEISRGMDAKAPAPKREERSPVAAKPAVEKADLVKPKAAKAVEARPADLKPAEQKPAATPARRDADLAVTMPIDPTPATTPVDAPAGTPTVVLAAATPSVTASASALVADDVSVNWDDIPILKDAVELEAAKGGPVDAERARKVAIQVAARLNVELRRAGKRSLTSTVVTRLAHLIQEELAPLRANVDNNKAKKS